MSIFGAVMVPHPPIILPEIGRGQEREIQETIDAYEQAAAFAAGLQADTYIISSPHTVMYPDYFHISPGRGAAGDMAAFGAPQVRLEADYDTELVRGITVLAKERGIPAGTLGERDERLDHASLIPLYFLRKYLQGSRPRIVRIGLSGLPLSLHYKLGETVRNAADALGRRIVWIASGDLSHKLKEDGPYGLSAEGPLYDRQIMEVMGSGNFKKLLEFPEDFCRKAAECGHRSFVMMAGALDGKNVQAQALSHQNTFGVGYGVCTYRVVEPDPYVRLARLAVEEYIGNGRLLQVDYDAAAEPGASGAAEKGPAFDKPGASKEEPAAGRQGVVSAASLPEDMLRRRAGAFVSLHEAGNLRGCIGTIAAVQKNLAEEIISNAVSACSLDPRFSKVRPDELPLLDISVDVLGPAEPVQSQDQLDARRYGVIVTKGARRGLLLPDLDGVDTPGQQIWIACRKAGIDPGEKGIKLERFEVVRHE